MNIIEEVVLSQTQRVDDLGVCSLKIIQDKSGFCFGVDAVLLANFTKMRKGYIGADLGTGTGIIPLLLLGKSEVAKIYAFEIQEEVASMARKSFELNSLEDRAEVICDNLKRVADYLEPSSLDFVVSNPPYMKADGMQNTNEKKRISRHEVACTLEDVFVSASYLLKEQRSFYLVHRPNRLCDIFELSRKYSLEPKEMRFIYPYPGKAANLLLLKMVKNGRPDLKMLPPLYLYDENRMENEELQSIYYSTGLEEE
ncbi:tRNA1(Val) (adenine(37)-N6)-methyltransferase [Filifactor villosus]|uniref:tRNA1(Val) (Adenine(37)-N6)-methyltransferase n=1 Tax=Filifactor villosus TaxID=29374 RepID=A0ABV9QLF1_9FIRM